MRDETERKVFEALNNKNWGASSTTLNDIARETYSYDKFQKIFKLIWEAADSPPRNWRKVFKSLMLCEYLVKNGCERCVDEIRDHSFRVRQLQDFNYYEDKLDRGQGVREKAKQLVELLVDNDVVREARENAKRLRDKFVGHGSGNRFSGQGGGSPLRGHLNSGGGYSDNNISSTRYSDKSDLSVGASYSDRSSPSDASGRYDSEPIIEPTDPAPLRIRPKLRTMPLIKLKSDTTSGTVVDTSSTSDPAPMQDLFTEQALESHSYMGATHSALPAQDSAFDPRGEIVHSEGHPGTSGESQYQPFAASFDTHMQLPQPPQSLQLQQMSKPATSMASQQPPLAQLPTQPQFPAYLQQPEASPALPFGEGFTTQSPANDDFGEFSACPQPTVLLAEATAVPAISADNMSSLCSLDSLSLNGSTPLSNSQATCNRGLDKLAYAQHAAFTGLDGFSTAPQPMRPSAMHPPGTLKPNYTHPPYTMGQTSLSPGGQSQQSQLAANYSTQMFYNGQIFQQQEL